MGRDGGKGKRKSEDDEDRRGEQNKGGKRCGKERKEIMKDVKRDEEESR